MMKCVKSELFIVNKFRLSAGNETKNELSLLHNTSFRKISQFKIFVNINNASEKVAGKISKTLRGSQSNIGSTIIKAGILYI